MLFNSIDFLIFFPIVLIVYFIIPDKIKYLWLLAASYYFYMCWNAKYAFLMLTSTVITYISGLLIEKIKKQELDEPKKQIYNKCVVAFSLIAYSVTMVQQDRASWCMATAKMVHAFRTDGALSFYFHYAGACLIYCTATAAIAQPLCRGNYSVMAFNRRMDSPLMVST